MYKNFGLKALKSLLERPRKSIFNMDLKRSMGGGGGIAGWIHLAQGRNRRRPQRTKTLTSTQA